MRVCDWALSLWIAGKPMEGRFSDPAQGTGRKTALVFRRVCGIAQICARGL